MAQHYTKVFRSPINTSISKNLYSFPKTDRFEKSRESPCQRSFYNIRKGAMSSRTTSFGFGNKVDLINKEGVPPPGSYDNKSEFLMDRVKRRGYSFSHDKRETFSRQLDTGSPGPGKYDRVYNNYTHLSYSIRSKYEDPLQRHKNQLGPGQYHHTPSLNSTGNYFNSKYRSSLCGRIGKATRFEDESHFSPGPGKYNDRLSINKSGVYFNSKIPSNFVKSFHGTSRLPINDPSQTPGPGTYYHFSDFAAINKNPL